MRYLIIKDFYTQSWATPFIGIIWFVVFTNFFTNGEPSRHVMLLAFLPAWLVCFSNETMKSFEKESALLISLPIARKEIVLAKYVASFIWFTVTFIAVIVYVFLFNTFALFPSRMMTIEEIVISFCLFVILISVFYPILFQAKFKVAAIVLMILTVFSIMVFNLCFNVFDNLGFISVSFACASVAILVVSYVLSVRIFNKRDLF